jgi:hypothetical protein
MPENNAIVLYTKTEGDEGYTITLERIANNDLLRLSVKGGEETMNRSTVRKLIAALEREAEQMK